MTEKENAVEEGTIATDLVVTKYKLAGEIANRVLQVVSERCVADASLTEICELGDKMIEEECAKVFKKEKDAKKGIAFPTCISINNCVCHYSPLKSDPVIQLKNGDMCKIDLGVHIDGFMALAGHTVVVGASLTNKVKGRAADALLAAHYASEVALRLVTPGVENDTVTDAVQRVADSFKCKPISGMLSHELKQFQMDGGKTIIQNPTDAQRREHAKNDFAVHEVYAIDCLITTGDGRTRDIDSKTTIYKRTEDIYQLRMKASRILLSDIEKKHGNMPFTLRSLENETKARMGVLECVKYRLLEPYGVLYDNPDDVIAQFKFTVLLMPSGSHKITGIAFDPNTCESENKLDEASVEILKKSVSTKSKKKNKNKAAGKEEKAGGDAKAAAK